MIAIDTNVLVYEIDFDEPIKQAKADALLQRLASSPIQTVLLWQVAAEYVACLRKWQLRGRVTAADVEFQARRALGLFPCEAPSPDVLLAAIDLATRHSLSHWDSMLVAACIVAGVDTLYSEDLTDGATYDTVSVINPFA
jgi:predicted nucleic acid-binding protein